MRALRHSRPILTLAACGFAAAAVTADERRPDGRFELAVWENTFEVIADGQETFRYDNFGNEDFWGGRLRLHEAIDGEANGGVGPGIAAATALGRGAVAPRTRAWRCPIGWFELAVWETTSEMIADGQEAFRYDNFGNEDFWGDRLRLHEAIAGEANGGVGPGIAPATALELGLKV